MKNMNMKWEKLMKFDEMFIFKLRMLSNLKISLLYKILNKNMILILNYFIIIKLK